MNKCRLLSLIVLAAMTSAIAQPRYSPTLQKEHLGRGLVAIRQDSLSTAVSWRLLETDAQGTAFNIYRDGQRINAKPLTEATFFTDDHATEAGARYEVVPVVKGREKGDERATYTLPADAPIGYINIPLDKPDGGTTPDGGRYGYTANDASVGDMDGDGEYEIVLKWEPTNAHDNAHDGYTGNVLFDCYRMNGERLWRIDLGPNVRAGAHYTQFMVFDLDGDNRAEVVMKTSDGTIDGQGNIIGDAFADYRHPGDIQSQEEQLRQDSIDEANMQKRFEEMRQRWQQDSARMASRGETVNSVGQFGAPVGMPPTPQGGQNNNFWRGQRKRTPPRQGRILTGNEYLTVFSGLTGEALFTTDYVPARGNLADWGDTKANRSDRYLACVAWLDGIHPSVVMCRGYYTRAVLAAWDWDGKELTPHWVFDSAEPGNSAYSGQGNHNLRVADVDGDGCDEIIYGSCVIDHDGKGLYSTGLGHGDAMHLTAFLPDDDHLQVWQCHESDGNGSTLRDAATGEILVQIRAKEDVGRSMAADIDPTHPGVEMWSSASGGLLDCHGEVIHEYVKGLSTNMAIWWDGDLSRELLDGTRISKYLPGEGRCDVIFDPQGVARNNGTKANPCLQGDIVGDWREELLARTDDDTALRLYVSTIPTIYRAVTFMSDPPYRISVATQNVAYNQPTQPGLYFGTDKKRNSK